MKTILPALLLFWSVNLFSQISDPGQPGFECAETPLRWMREKQDPESKVRQALADQITLENTTTGSTASKSSAPVFTLPVVVHIIHNNGPENLPDAQVFKAIQHLNEAFANSGSFALPGSGVNTQIQFCLARRTSEGLATNGIVRVQSPLTHMTLENDDQNMKDLSRWNPSAYVNIWVVASITSTSSGPGVAGYATLAGSHGAPNDGLVVEAAFFGVSPELETVAIHEIGHYLNLYHTFEGGCLNDDCILNGDRVCDTPPDQAQHTTCPYNSCSTDANAPAPNPFSADVDDMTENYMDYSPFSCYSRFTQGQSERMRLAVEFIRYSLLDSKGCLDPCTLPLVAAFAANPDTVIAGSSVIFTNQSSGAAYFDWLLDGGSFSDQPNTFYTFDLPGLYNVTLIGNNDDPNCTDSTSQTIVVTCPVAAGLQQVQRTF